MFNIGIVNQSKRVSDTDLKKWVKAVQKQVNNDFTPIWGTWAILTNPAGPSQYVKIPFPLYVQEISDVPGALGYHDIDANGQPYIKVFAAESAGAGIPLSAVISHEVLELLADPFVEAFALDDTNNGTGFLYAAEVCDPVEGDLYDKGGVAVSNFITPWWLTAQPPKGARFDFLGRLSRPFTITPGGYYDLRPITKHGGLGRWRQVAGYQAKFWNGKER